jgi:hypothetical protein
MHIQVLLTSLYPLAIKEDLFKISETLPDFDMGFQKYYILSETKRLIIFDWRVSKTATFKD